MRNMACVKLLLEGNWRDLSVIPVKELGEREDRKCEDRVSEMVADNGLWKVTLFLNSPQFCFCFFGQITKLPVWKGVDLCGKCPRAAALPQSAPMKPSAASLSGLALQLS